MFKGTTSAWALNLVMADSSGQKKECMNHEIDELAVACDELNMREVSFAHAFLNLPNEIIGVIYPYLDIRSRHAMRVNGRLEKIEFTNTAVSRNTILIVTVKQNNVHLSVDGSEVEIPYSEVEKEFELMGKNTYFDEVHYQSSPLDDRRAVNAAKLLNTKKLYIEDTRINDADFRFFAQHREEINCNFDCPNYMWIYEKMVEPHPDFPLKRVYIESEYGDASRWHFLEEMGLDDIQDLYYDPTDPNQQIYYDGDASYVNDGRLEIKIKMTEAESDDDWERTFGTREPGYVQFTIRDEAGEE